MERMFLITKKINGKLTVLGYVTSTHYPSTIANDQEKAKEMFGYEYVTISEIGKKCHVELCDC